MHRMEIDTNPANYEPNSINDNWPRETPPAAKRGGFESLAERVDGEKIRQRSPSFGEYYAQPRLFWLSQTPIEQQHIIDGFSFELSKVVRTWIRERVVDHLAHIDTRLAEAVGANLGIELSDEQRSLTLPSPVNGVEKDPTLSLYADAEGDVKGRVVAVLLNERTSRRIWSISCRRYRPGACTVNCSIRGWGKSSPTMALPCRSPAPSPAPRR